MELAKIVDGWFKIWLWLVRPVGTACEHKCKGVEMDDASPVQSESVRMPRGQDLAGWSACSLSLRGYCDNSCRLYNWRTNGLHASTGPINYSRPYRILIVNFCKSKRIKISISITFVMSLSRNFTQGLISK
jgi:hypothetical protein